MSQDLLQEVLSKIGAFLDTLPDEHQPNLDLIKKSWYTEGYHDALFRLEPIWIIRDLKYVENPKCGQPLPEQPVEGLDAEIENYFGNIPDDTDKIDIARHFYDLGLNGKK